MNYVCLSATGCDLDRFRTEQSRLIVVDYGHEHDRPECDFYFHVGLFGEGKWKNIRYALKNLSASVMLDMKGSYWWFPDPDVTFPAGTIERMFETARRARLDLCQPALTEESKCSHGHLIAQTKDTIRRVPFVEVMCPLFSSDGLQRNFWTFDLNTSGYGLDLYWGKKELCYVMDGVRVEHLDTPHYPETAFKYGFTDPHDDMAEVRRLYMK